MDAIAEIRVVLNSYSAEFGRNTGPQINVVTRSGTQRYSGSLSGIVRHEALNSNTLANERLGVPKPIARYYTGVGTLGGPVWLPGKGKLSRTFFFYTREQWDTNVGSTANTKKMPTALERAGDFSQTTQTNGNAFFIRDPNLTGACSSTTGGPACFPGNKIPTDRINPLGLAMLNLFPQPNFDDISVSQRQYNFRDVDVPHVYRALDQLTVDHNFTGGDRLQVKYRHWRPNRESTTGTFGVASNWNHFRSQYAQKEDALTVNYTRSLTNRLVSEFSFGFRDTPEVAPLDTLPDPISKVQRPTTGPWQSRDALQHAVPQRAQSHSADELRGAARPGSRHRVGCPLSDRRDRSPLHLPEQHDVGGWHAPREGWLLLRAQPQQ